jgi:hypothetical protein
MIMLIRKALYMAGLAGFMPWLYPSTLLAVDSIHTTHPIEQSFQIARGRRRAYQPPANARISRRQNNSGGVRGSGGPIALIAPHLSYTGQTSSTHPTFVWYSLSDSPQYLELHLRRYQPDGSLEAVSVRPIGESRSSGYMSYTLPENEPGLTIGETYVWEIVAYSDSNLENISNWTNADIEVVSLPADLTAALSEDSLNNAQIYSDLGLWYDAIMEVSHSSTPAAESLRQDLLLDLSELEAQTVEDATEGISTQLRAIAEIQ